MANLCEYEIHIKGSKKAILLFFYSIPWLDYKEIIKEIEFEDKYILHFIGNCKWSLNHNTTNVCDINDFNVENLNEEDIIKGNFNSNLYDYNLKIKSKLLNCDIEVHSWCDESNFESFEHYKNGELITFDTFYYEEDYELDWFLDEYSTIDEFFDDYGLDMNEENFEIRNIEDDYNIVHFFGSGRLNFSFDF